MLMNGGVRAVVPDISGGAVVRFPSASVVFFFFQAADGIRDTSVTGVQTCALPILSVSRGMQLVATTDAVVEGVHFDLERFSPEDVGWKALAVNLSDLAAAGARPRWFLCALGVPKSGRRGQLVRRISRGMAPLAKRTGCALVGGNFSRASEWSVTITALGEARRPLSRSGARPGDALVVVGTLGDAAAGLRPYPSPAASRAQRRPMPLVREGEIAAAQASAAIDVSDGFLQD